MIVVAAITTPSATDSGHLAGATSLRRTLRYTTGNALIYQEIGAAVVANVSNSANVRTEPTLFAGYRIGTSTVARHHSSKPNWGLNNSSSGNATAGSTTSSNGGTDSSPTGEMVVNNSLCGMDLYGVIVLEKPSGSSDAEWQRMIEDAQGWSWNRWAVNIPNAAPCFLYEGDSTTEVPTSSPTLAPGWNRVLHDTYLPDDCYGQNLGAGGDRALYDQQTNLNREVVNGWVWSGRVVYMPWMIGTNDIGGDGAAASDVVAGIEADAGYFAGLGAFPIWLGCCPDHQGDSAGTGRNYVSTVVRDNCRSGANDFAGAVDTLENDSAWGWTLNANASAPSFMGDTTHPNTAGNADIAAKFAAAFNALYAGPKPKYISGSITVALSGTVATITDGTSWDSQSNGSVTRVYDYRVNGSNVITGATDLTPQDLAAYLTAGDLVTVKVRASNTGGNDATQDKTSPDVTYVEPTTSARRRAFRPEFIRNTNPLAR